MHNVLYFLTASGNLFLNYELFPGNYNLLLTVHQILMTFNIGHVWSPHCALCHTKQQQNFDSKESQN